MTVDPGTVSREAGIDVSRYQVPPSAAWLGGLGAVPFVSLSSAGLFLDESWRSLAAQALVAYGAVILSFLGGIRWGLAISGRAEIAEGSRLMRRLALSICPSVVGWCALLLPQQTALITLGLAFVTMLLIDLRPEGCAEAPAWYPRLRWPLTLAVVVSLVTAIGWAV